MADVYGRLTGRAAVAMATLGPGRHEPPDRHRGRLPRSRAGRRDHRPGVLGEAAQGGAPGRRRRRHVQARHEVERPHRADRGDPRDRPQGVPGGDAREAGPTHIELPENVAGTAAGRRTTRSSRWSPGKAYFPEPSHEAIAHAARLINEAQRPIVLAGNGVLRRRASGELRAFAKGLHLPVAATFMGKGAIDDRSHLSLMAVGLQARDHVLTGFDRADLVIAVGYDLVEYAPAYWNPDGVKRIIHIDTQPAEVDGDYQPEIELIGDIGGALEELLAATLPGGVGGRSATQRHESRETLVHADLRTALLADLHAGESDDGYPITPQRAIFDLRRALGPERHRGQRRRRAQDLGRAPVPGVRAEHGDHLERVRVDGHRPARCDRGEARPPGAARRGAVRRRRLPHERPGARDGEADRRRDRRRDLARQRLRADRLEAAQRVRAAVRRRVRQPGLRRRSPSRSGSRASGPRRRTSCTRR